MTGTTEQDLEQLEAFLDGELSPEVAERLRLRLSADPGLAASLGWLRAQRALRSSFFASLEPDAAAAHRIVDDVRREIIRDQLWGERRSSLQRVAAIAACVVFAFVGGWVIRSQVFGGGETAVVPEGVLPAGAVAQAPETPAHSGMTFLPGTIDQWVAPPGTNGVRLPVNTQSVAANANGANAPANGGGYMVKLFDTGGQLVGVRRFNTVDEARAFLDNFRRLQQQQNRRDPVLVKEQF